MTITQPAETAAPEVPKPARVGSELWCEVVDWLYHEAELLDEGRDREWLELLSHDVVYQIPIRQTVERARGAGFLDTTFHLDERYGSIEARVRRNETAFAWAEDPPSRARHFVGNIRVADRGDGTVEARSNLLLYRTRADQTVPQLMAGERRDVLRREDGELRLLRRSVLLDLTALGTHNLAIFF